ncbi:ATP/GTP-binding protein, partial [uncultured Fibrobacter sp.]|uniref:AAA family ATPase n=1 Tax=uncultured Fibrobacter sp. TaxID=261512 RepID=UPI0025CDD6A6
KDGSFTEAFFPNDEMESEGTKKIINMSGPIVDSLLNGGILVVDEFDAKLHPLLTKKIIDTFNSPGTNPYNAQLIFATHDTNLLSNKIFRRDQIWFAEKNREDESTDIYPLSEIKEQNGDKIRNDRVYEKDYINGKYGAIPYLRG